MTQGLSEQDVKKLLNLIKVAFPSFEISEQVILLWTMLLKDRDKEMVNENFKEYVLSSKFPPTIHDLAKPNEEVRARRVKEETKAKMLQLETQQFAPPPWEREGLTQKEWMARILERKGAAQ